MFLGFYAYVPRFLSLQSWVFKLALHSWVELKIALAIICLVTGIVHMHDCKITS